MFDADTDCSTITPSTDQFPDVEERYTVCFIEAIRAAHEYAGEIYSARVQRGAPAEAIEADQTTLVDLEQGYGRALDRRRRELATLGGELVRPARVRGGRR